MFNVRTQECKNARMFAVEITTIF